MYRVLRLVGKTAETLEQELNEAGQDDFHVVAVTGLSDRRAEMLVLEKHVAESKALPQGEAGWSVNRDLHRPAAATVRSRLGQYED